MNKTLDLLLVESHPQAGDSTAEALESQGHRVHRCYEAGHDDLSCRAVVEHGGCPIDQHVDVAVFVRRDADDMPTQREDGVRCAVRAGVPVVGVHASEGPYARFVTTHANGDVSGACLSAFEGSFESLSDDILSRVALLLHAAGLSDHEAHCTIDSDWPTLNVRLDIDAEVDRSLEQALAVRALDAVRSGGQTFGQVNVEVAGRAWAPA